jgi:hypothetical protein
VVELEVGQICRRIECACNLAEERTVVPEQMHRMRDKELILYDPKSPNVGLAEIDNILGNWEGIVPTDNLRYHRLGRSISWLILFKVQRKTVSFVAKAPRSILTRRVDACAVNPVN